STPAPRARQRAPRTATTGSSTRRREVSLTTHSHAPPPSRQPSRPSAQSVTQVLATNHANPRAATTSRNTSRPSPGTVRAGAGAIAPDDVGPPAASRRSTTGRPCGSCAVAPLVVTAGAAQGEAGIGTVAPAGWPCAGVVAPREPCGGCCGCCQACAGGEPAGFSGVPGHHG